MATAECDHKLQMADFKKVEGPTYSECKGLYLSVLHESR